MGPYIRPLFKQVILVKLLIISVVGFSQKKFNVTSNKANNYCNGICTLFDMADLNGNPTAILFITPMEVNGINLNPHPITAYYNGKQWSVMNADNNIMSPGSQFNVEYYLIQDETHFLHIVTKENRVKGNSYIDHIGLNDNPNAQFKLFQNASPNVRGGLVNKEEVTAHYDASQNKWYIADNNGKTLDDATGYAIVISAGTQVVTHPSILIPPLTTPVHPFTDTTTINTYGPHIFITVTGMIQGIFTAESTKINRTELTGLEMDATSPKDANGLSMGKRVYAPATIQKESGTSTIQFFKAFATNEALANITVEVYKGDPKGARSILDYKIVLTNASISDFKQISSEGKPGVMNDVIRITFQSIEIMRWNMNVADSPSITN